MSRLACSRSANIRWFYSRTRRDGSCLIWTGPTSGQGAYPAFYPRGAGRGGMVYGHRWIYEQKRGAIPRGMVIMHRCDRPRCVSLRHLRLGTHSENHIDKENKGRGTRIGSVSIGDIFGRWGVLSQAAALPGRRTGTRWLCQCSCGTERVVTGRLLRTGKSTSCGCYMRELQRVLLIARNKARARHAP